MADPVSIGLLAVSMGAAAGGGILAAEGGLFGGKAQQAQFGYQSAIADMNSRLAKADAEYTKVAGEREAEISGLKGREIVGSTVAGMGAGNIDPTKGSAKNVLASEATVNAANENMIRANAAKRAFGFEVTAAEDTAQGRLYGMSGKTAMTAAEIGATSSLLGAAGSVSSKWLQAKQVGLIGGGDNPGVNPDSAAGRDVYSASIYG